MQGWGRFSRLESWRLAIIRIKPLFTTQNKLSLISNLINDEINTQQQKNNIKSIEDAYNYSLQCHFVKQQNITLKEKLNQSIIAILEFQLIDTSNLSDIEKLDLLINYFFNISEFDCLIFKIKNIDESKIKSLPNQTNINISTKENLASTKINALLEKNNVNYFTKNP